MHKISFFQIRNSYPPLFLVLGLLCFFSLKASDLACDLCQILNQGRWEAEAALIYWQPSTSHLLFAQQQKLTGVNDQRRNRYVRPQFTFGFRILGGYVSCDEAERLVVSYTHLFCRSTDKVYPIAGATLVGFQSIGASPGYNVLGQVKDRYDKINLRASRLFACCCQSRLYAFLGVRYLLLQEIRFTRTASSAVNQIFLNQDRSTYKAVGMEVGFGADCTLWKGYSLCFEVAATAHLGEKKEVASFQSTNIDGSLVLATIQQIPSHLSGVPGIEAKIEVNYSKRLPCKWWCALSPYLVVALGWEINYYYQALYKNWPLLSQNTLSEVDVAFMGPFASLKVRF